MNSLLGFGNARHDDCYRVWYSALTGSTLHIEPEAWANCYARVGSWVNGVFSESRSRRLVLSCIYCAPLRLGIPLHGGLPRPMLYPIVKTAKSHTPRLGSSNTRRRTPPVPEAKLTRGEHCLAAALRTFGGLACGVVINAQALTTRGSLSYTTTHSFNTQPRHEFFLSHQSGHL